MPKWMITLLKSFVIRVSTISLTILIIIAPIIIPSLQRPEHVQVISGRMKVSKTLYSKTLHSTYSPEKDYGAPGWYMIEVIVYELPAKTAKEIQKHGTHYFDAPSSQDLQKKPDWRKSYRVWQTTPITEEDWMSRSDPTSASSPLSPHIRCYLSKTRYHKSGCGDVIGDEIDPAILQSIDDIISKPGSFFAYANGPGIIIVAPEARRVIYAYHA